ncbi:hypothetical protein DFH09DRAFT_1079656 [Mycena vulgaris]|nr:hypothetical protein DFH09DRAFT_1079656 [Mycena vulgaris]
MFYAALYLRDGRLSEAKYLFQKSLTRAWGMDVQAVTYCLAKLADIHCWGNIDEISPSPTIVFLVHSLKLNQKLHIHQALRFLGDLYQAEGDPHTATNFFNIALEGFTQMDIHRSGGECILRLGDIAGQDGYTATAVELWKTARPLLERSLQAKQVDHIDDRLAVVAPDYPEMQGKPWGGLGPTFTFPPWDKKGLIQ